MLSTAPIIAFTATTNAAEARRFYADTLGLTLVADEPFALVFDAHGTMLRIQKAGPFEPHPFTQLGWRVVDIVSSVRALVEKGVAMKRYDGFDQDELGIWRIPSGPKIAWFADPDGNTLSLTEF